MVYAAAHGHSGTLGQGLGAWPTRAHRRITGDLMTTRLMTCPPPRLKLHTTTPTPQQRQPERCPLRSNSGSAVVFGVEVDKQLQTRIEAPGSVA
jgi:hypothetical protein